MRASDSATNDYVIADPNLLQRVLRKHMMEARSKANDNLSRSQQMVLLYFVLNFSDQWLTKHLSVDSANLLAPPLAAKNRGLNVPWSTSRILSSYIRCLDLSWRLYQEAKELVQFEVASGLKTHTSKMPPHNDRPKSLEL